MRLNYLTLLPIVGALIGCANANIESDRSALSAVKACCSNTGALPPPSALAPVNALKFDAEAPHYDFGFGLTPFARFTIDPNTSRRLALVSVSKGSSPLLGGDGYQHYVDLQVAFFDSQGNRLTAPPPSAPMIAPKPKDLPDTAASILTRVVDIPAGATEVVVTSSAQQLGKRDTTMGIAPDASLLVGRLLLPIQGGERVFTYVHSVYGNAYLLAGGKVAE